MSAGSTQANVGLLIADRYRTTDVIGRGGQSMVCRAEDTHTGQAVAVKILRSAAASDPQAAGRFQREQQALMALAGSNVVKVIDTCRLESGALCLVMELLEGESLEQRLGQLEAKCERASLRDLGSIIEPIVDTLEQAHGLGIIHRDLKPANIFLLDRGGVRLLDFGFARLKSAIPLTGAGMVMGSPSYIAPEVWRGTPHLVDHRADVYSLAVILFRMLAGQLPLWSESLPTMLTLATTAARPSLKQLRPDLPEDVDLWVRQALAIEPNERFHSARALLNALYMATSPPVTEQAGRIGEVLRSAAAAVKRWALRDDSERSSRKRGAAKAESARAMVPDAKTLLRIKPSISKQPPKPSRAPSAKPASPAREAAGSREPPPVVEAPRPPSAPADGGAPRSGGPKPRATTPKLGAPPSKPRLKTDAPSAAGRQRKSKQKARSRRRGGKTGKGR